MEKSEFGTMASPTRHFDVTGQQRRAAGGNNKDGAASRVVFVLQARLGLLAALQQNCFLLFPAVAIMLFFRLCLCIVITQI